jgi:hypothetical protein
VLVIDWVGDSITSTSTISLSTSTKNVGKDEDDQQRKQVYFYEAYGNLLSHGGSSLTPYDLLLTTYLYRSEKVLPTSYD